TPDCRTVEEVTRFLGIPPQEIIKTLLYETDTEVVAVLVRGDRDVNEIKLLNLLGCLRVDLAGENTIKKVTGASRGFSGPVGLQGVKIIADLEVPSIVNAVTGANRDHVHLLNVNPGRDFSIDILTDVRMVEAGEPCPRCGQELKEARGIEVGQIFKLGDKYSKLLGATYLGESGKAKPIIMGCYGIGVTRTMAAAIEQNNDLDGIVWPAAIAPFHAVVIPVNTKDPEQVALAEKIYTNLTAAGVETILDDRSERAGVKFKDADLIGYPLRIIVGAKAVSENTFEVKVRRSGEVTVVPGDKLEQTVLEMLSDL
ncbi:MAG: YbaK/EbsC family protein, partial [Desulfotomaculaceae bacterium]|nr:YbaK/EbsC family protein [Desulfotomaculaceae bacterium]